MTVVSIIVNYGLSDLKITFIDLANVKLLDCGIEEEASNKDMNIVVSYLLTLVYPSFKSSSMISQMTWGTTSLCNKEHLTEILCSHGCNWAGKCIQFQGLFVCIHTAIIVYSVTEGDEQVGVLVRSYMTPAFIRYRFLYCNLTQDIAYDMVRLMLGTRRYGVDSAQQSSP